MIEVAGLRVEFPPDVVAVDGIDLTVRPGEFVVVLGRSGSGKTTLLRTLNRLVEPTAGLVRVDGRTVTGAGSAELRAIRRHIGMIFQQFNLVRRVSVIDNVLVAHGRDAVDAAFLTSYGPSTLTGFTVWANEVDHATTLDDPVVQQAEVQG